MPDETPLPIEFDHIAQTAIQAKEDRARVSSLYLIAVGTLRAAGHESALAMNQLKDDMMSVNQSLIEAFGGKTSMLLSRYKRDSVSYYPAVEVALISGLVFGAALYFLQQAFFQIFLFHWILAALGGFLTIYLQLFLYQRALK